MRKTKEVSKEDFKKDLIKNWRIDGNLIDEIMEKHPNVPKKYSPEHHVYLKRALKEYLEKVDDEDYRKAYIAAQKRELKLLNDPTAIDFAISVLTGGCAVSLFSKDAIELHGIVITLVIFFILVALIIIKCFIITDEKSKFKLAILDEIEKEFDNK